MVIGVSRISLSLPGNDSLKGKRRMLRRIVDRCRNQFNVAIAEVGRLDEHRAAQLGVAVVSNDASHANSMLDKVLDFIPGLTEAIVVGHSLELIHVSGELDAGLGGIERGTR
jgi:uncharacterized protein YlxP (DUF503 family)